MSSAAAWPVRVAAVGPVAVGSQLWRLGGMLNATVMVKATFAMVAQQAMTLAAPEPVELSERSEDGSPARSLCAVREIAPGLRQVDVVLYGHAHAGASTTRSTARLAIVRDGRAVLDKTLTVVGDRRRGAESAPFQRIPVCFERALGGIGFAENPFGVGAGTSTKTEPNFLDPVDPSGRVGCFGPIPAIFPARKKLLAGGSRSALEGLVADIPSSLDWSYFQCAPPDQRLAELRGDEWLELEGLTPDLRLRTRLPDARARVRIYGPPGDDRVPEWITLTPDLVQIFADRQRCTIVWRGSLPVADEQLASALRGAGGIELPGQPLRWPATPTEVDAWAGPAPASPARGGPAPGDDARTMFLDGSLAGAPGMLAGGRMAPDATMTIDGSAPPAPGLPWETLKAEDSPAEDSPEEPQARPPEGPAAGQPPVPGAPWSQEPAMPVPVPLAEGARTLAVGLPFERASRGDEQAEPASEPRAIPGAPWAAEPAKAVPAPSGEGAQTLALGVSPLAGEDVPQAEPEGQGPDAEAEARRKVEADAEARREAEAQAEARRKAEAERFAAEQRAAEAEEARRAAEQHAKDEQAAAELLDGLYGGFPKDKR